MTVRGVGTEAFYSCRGAGMGIEEQTCQWLIRNICRFVEQRFKVAPATPQL